jgi:hypothetical protein
LQLPATAPVRRWTVLPRGLDFANHSIDLCGDAGPVAEIRYHIVAARQGGLKHLQE